jgi:hypothetical protein
MQLNHKCNNTICVVHNFFRKATVELEFTSRLASLATYLIQMCSLGIYASTFTTHVLQGLFSIPMILSSNYHVIAIENLTIWSHWKDFDIT